MSRGQQAPRRPDPDEQFDRQREAEMGQTATSIASQVQSPSDVFEDEDHWDRLLAFDIDRDDGEDELGETFKTELSDVYTKGNLQREDWRRFGFWAENEVHTALKEYPDADSAVTGTRYNIYYGQDMGLNGEGERAVKPPLTPEQVRRFWSMADAKKAGMSGAIGARFLRALTEITAVGVTERKEKEQKGVIQRIKDRL